MYCSSHLRQKKNINNIIVMCFLLTLNKFNGFQANVPFLTTGKVDFQVVSYNSNFNPFQPNVPFLFPLKTSENLWFSNIFRGYRNGTLALNGLQAVPVITFFLYEYPSLLQEYLFQVKINAQVRFQMFFQFIYCRF